MDRSLCSLWLLWELRVKDFRHGDYGGLREDTEGFGPLRLSSRQRRICSYGLPKEDKSFTGGADGSGPVVGLIRDSAGNLYGTTSGGGVYCNGTVFELSPGRTFTMTASN